jgi:hypothetical protein
VNPEHFQNEITLRVVELQVFWIFWDKVQVVNFVQIKNYLYHPKAFKV